MCAWRFPRRRATVRSQLLARSATSLRRRRDGSAAVRLSGSLIARTMARSRKSDKPDRGCTSGVRADHSARRLTRYAGVELARTLTLDAGVVRGDPVLRMDAVRRELRGIALALVMVAATTVIAYAADPLPRCPARLGDLSAAGAAGRLASRPHPGAGRGGRRRAVVGLFLLFAVLQLLPRAPERDPQSGAVHGGRGGHQPPRQFDEAADRDRPQARERDERSLRLLAPAGGRPLGRRDLRPRSRSTSPTWSGARCAVRRRRGRDGRHACPTRRRCRSACAPRSRSVQRGTTLAPPSTTAPATSGWCAASRRRTPISASSPSISAACRRTRSPTSASGSTTCSPTPPPRSSASTSPARSTTPRCAPRPNCCARR